MNNTERLEQTIDKLDLDWTCKHGLIHTNPVKPTDEPSTLNGVLYTGIVIAMIEKAILDEKVERTDKIDGFLRRKDAAIVKCYQNRYPMICRSPTNTDQQGPDDLKGYLAYLTATGDKAAAQDFLDYSERSSVSLRPWLPRLTRWMNNSRDQDRKYTKLENPTFLEKLKHVAFAPWGYKPWISPWMGRFPALIWQAQLAAGSVGSFWRMLWASLSIAEQAFLGNAKKPDRWYMDWTMIASNELALEKSKFIKRLSKLWFKRLYKLYPNGMMGVFQQYTAQHDTQFPLGEFFLE